VGHTGIHAWGNRVRRQFFGGGAVVVEPRIPCLQAWGVSTPTWLKIFTILKPEEMYLFQLFYSIIIFQIVEIS
jgi:hypothetical protein